MFVAAVITPPIGIHPGAVHVLLVIVTLLGVTFVKSGHELVMVNGIQLLETNIQFPAAIKLAIVWPTKVEGFTLPGGLAEPEW